MVQVLCAVRYEILKKTLECKECIKYNRITKGTTTSYKRLAEYSNDRIATLSTAKFTRVVFLYPFPGFRKRY